MGGGKEDQWEHLCIYSFSANLELLNLSIRKILDLVVELPQILSMTEVGTLVYSTVSMHTVEAEGYRNPLNN